MSDSKAKYVDSYVAAVPTANLERYRKLAEQSAKVWRKHGALSYTECVAEDVQPGKLTSFPQAVQQKSDEVVIIAWIEYESREARDRCLELVMKDPEMDLEDQNMPFDGTRMFWGGFKPLVQL